MTARDIYWYDVRCEKCGKEGRVHASENDGWSFKGSSGFQIDVLPDGFYVHQKGPSSTLTKLACSNCRVIVNG